MVKNTAGQVIGAQMTSATDGSAFTGAVTVYVTGDAGTQAVGSVGAGACTHEGNGFHTYAPAQAETNYAHVAFTFIGTGAIPATVQVYPRAAVQDANVTQIDGLATNGNNATLNLKQLNIVNSAGSALVAQSTGGNGNGADIRGNGSGHGLYLVGESTGAGLACYSTGAQVAAIVQALASDKSALYLRGHGGGAGLLAQGGAAADSGATGQGHGFAVYGGDGAGQAHGIYGIGGGTGNGVGIKGDGATSGAGIGGLGGATTGAGIRGSAANANSAGIEGQGNGSGPGLRAIGGATGAGLQLDGGSTSGFGLHLNPTGGSAAVSGSIINDAAADAILDRAIAEPSARPSWASFSLRGFIQWVGAISLNKITQTSTTQTLRNDADVATIATVTVSDDGTTTTKGKAV